VSLKVAGASLALVASLGLPACAPAPRDTARPAPAGAGGFVQVVLPFPVADSAGRSLELAFLGGLNAPRPQLVDADGDGDLDLFLQEVTGSVMLFERDGMRDGLPRFVLRTARYGDLDVGEWYRFADVDADGDLDLLAEQPYSYIKYYRNDGPAEAYRFVLVADTLRATDGKPIFSDRQNIPQLGDLDCNGRSDLLIGRLDGTVARYEAAPDPAGGAPAFGLVASEFEGIRIIGQQGGPAVPAGPLTPFGGPNMHGANTMALSDADGDRDLDLFWGDFFEPGLLLLQNRGSCAEPNFRAPPVQFPVGAPVLTSGYNAPTFGARSDGATELVLGVLGGAYNPLRTSADNLYYLERGPGAGEAWLLRTRRLLPVLDLGSETIPAVTDLDGDGDLDILLANKLDPTDLKSSRLYPLENIGTSTHPSFRLRRPLPITGRYHAAPAFADLDGDGRADMLLGEWGPRVAWYRAGPSGFALVDSALVTIPRGSNTTPAPGDLDGDGDVDLLIGESSGWLNFYRNTGSAAYPRFALETEAFDSIKVNRRSAPHLADIDGDGDLDLLVGSELDGLRLYRNQGSRTAATFARDTTFAPPVPALAAPAVADFDADGRMDVVVGSVGGGAVYLKGAGRLGG
jgi:FG-GAP-like repeat